MAVIYGGKMLYRKFGKLDWKVSAIGLGTYAIGGNWGNQDQKVSEEAILQAIDLGVNFLDTADVYGYGKAENYIGNVLGNRRSQVYIASKGGRDFVSSPPQLFKNFDVDYLERALEASLKRLKTDYLDLYQIHGPSIEIMETGKIFGFLEKMKSKGKIRAAGVSLNNLEEVNTALRSNVIDSVQYPFNLLEQGDGISVFKKCSQNNVAVIVREPLCQGLLTGKYSIDSKFTSEDHRSSKWTNEYLLPRLEKLSRIMELKGKDQSIIDLAIQFPLAFSEVSVVIPGGRNKNQVINNINAISSKQIDTTELGFLLSL
ncbi:MAG: hypothetical protein CVU42_00255 [Chloroflexi bacterium HGW-Chloroflexi-4]|jgi:aryl-alcohol dehydrogenase-like predicted oxidoreductase|nr:MAG: hypothetical protein CVU42_00255 [Chloroflexi bacterium HGW-Chloroflexi-4]